MKHLILLASGFVLLIVSGCTHSPERSGAGAADLPEWMKISNQFHDDHIRAMAVRHPSMGSGNGFREYDANAPIVEDDEMEKERAMNRQWIATAKLALGKTTDIELRTDYKIFIRNLEKANQWFDIQLKHGIIDLPGGNGRVMGSIISLVNPQSLPGQKQAAVKRFHDMVNGFDGHAPLLKAMQSQVLYLEKRAPKKRPLWPALEEVKKYLADSPTYISELKQRLQSTGVSGWENDYETYVKQATEYDEFIRTYVLPKSPERRKLPRELYVFNLKEGAVDIAPEKLIKMAKAEFPIVYKEYTTVAAQIATNLYLEKRDPVSVIEHLKKSQVTKPDEVKALYENANRELETLISTNQLVTLPKAPLVIRILEEAESRGLRAPSYDCRSRANYEQGQQSEYLIPASPEGKTAQDDFSFSAAALALTAHEARPGHDLECVAKRESASISKLREGNSEIAEGWGLYAERIVYPYLSPEAQLAGLRMYLLRIARAFLDPELQLGLTTNDIAKQIITDELGFTKEWADTEVQRYTFLIPGQAPSYYYGMKRIEALKTKMKEKLSKNYVESCFNDAFLQLSFLPAELIEERVAETAAKTGTLCAPTKTVL